jgi:hypothetical protein
MGHKNLTVGDFRKMLDGVSDDEPLEIKWKSYLGERRIYLSELEPGDGVSVLYLDSQPQSFDPELEPDPESGAGAELRDVLPPEIMKGVRVLSGEEGKIADGRERVGRVWLLFVRDAKNRPPGWTVVEVVENSGVGEYPDLVDSAARICDEFEGSDFRVQSWSLVKGVRPRVPPEENSDDQEGRTD